MKLKTHFMIAKIAAEYSNFSLCKRILFCIGSVIPDLSPMRFVHRHFYSNSSEYVFKKLDKLSGNYSFLAILSYGKIAHFVSDFCCSVHSDGSIGKIKEHFLYEKKLNKYILDNFFTLKSESKRFIESATVKNILEEYCAGKKYDFYTDCTFAIKGCISVCEMSKVSVINYSEIGRKNYAGNYKY